MLLSQLPAIIYRCLPFHSMPSVHFSSSCKSSIPTSPQPAYAVCAVNFTSVSFSQSNACTHSSIKRKVSLATTKKKLVISGVSPLDTCVVKISTLCRVQRCAVCHTKPIYKISKMKLNTHTHLNEAPSNCKMYRVRCTVSHYATQYNIQ